MSKQPNLDCFLTVRVSKSSRTKFHRKAMHYGKPSDVMREIVDAFVEGRLVIQPSPTKRNLYHVN